MAQVRGDDLSKEEFASVEDITGRIRKYRDWDTGELVLDPKDVEIAKGRIAVFKERQKQKAALATRQRAEDAKIDTRATALMKVEDLVTGNFPTYGEAYKAAVAEQAFAQQQARERQAAETGDYEALKDGDEMVGVGADGNRTRTKKGHIGTSKNGKKWRAIGLKPNGRVEWEKVEAAIDKPIPAGMPAGSKWIDADTLQLPDGRTIRKGP